MVFSFGCGPGRPGKTKSPLGLAPEGASLQMIRWLLDHLFDGFPWRAHDDADDSAEGASFDDDVRFHARRNIGIEQV
jgi:hypothetical protein